MNPPPRRPDDESPPPPPPPPPAWEVVETPDPGPAPRPANAPRDPLIDDPLFTEIVGDRSSGVDLPLAELAESAPTAPPPVDPASLPRAEPVRPRAEPVPPPRREPPRDRPPPIPRRRDEPAEPDEQPRPQVAMACGVIGCLGVAFLGAVAFLAYVAITVLSQLGDRTGSRDQPPDPAAVTRARPDPVAPPPKPLAQTTVALGGRFDAVGRGAGGRFLFLRVSNPQTGQHELAVFDPNVGALLGKRVPLGDPRAVFAGGASKLFVYKPQKQEIERWDLVTWEREESRPTQTAADAVVVGQRADEPVYLVSSQARGVSFHAVDPVTLARTGTHQSTALQPNGPIRVRASDDGTVIGVGDGTTAAVFRFTQNGTKLDANPLGGFGAGPGVAVPSPDGQHVYTPRGVYSGNRVVGAGPPALCTFPTAHGSDLFLGFRLSAAGLTQGSAGLYLAGTPSQTPAASLPEITLRAADVAALVPPDQRVHLWPAAGLAAVLPTSNDKIELHEVDVGAVLKQARATGPEYIVFGSDPPTTAVRGREWRYKPVVWAAPGLPVITLANPPAGMTVTPDGAVVWTPDGPADGVTVHVRAVSGLSGMLADQKFRLTVLDNPDE